MKSLKQISVYTWVLVVIVIGAFVLRFINIANNPPSVYGDEISFAWNAWNILHTGADEYGVAYPLQFRAFDDFKAPIPVYLLVPIFKVWGMHALSVRMPVVIVATATVVATYLLVRELFGYFYKDTSDKHEKIALLASGLLAISPWHIHLSRGFFESTLALLPFVLGSYFLLKSRDNPRFLYASSVSFAVSLYTYFTPRIILIVFLPFLAFYFRKMLFTHKKTAIRASVLFILLLLPLVKLALFDAGGNRLLFLLQERMNQAVEQVIRERSVAGEPSLLRTVLHNRYGVFLRTTFDTYFEHFSLNFWYLFGDNSLRYFLGNMGMFFRFELPFLFIGLYGMFRDFRKAALFLLGWLLIAPIPAALVGRSFAVRSLAMLPVPLVFVAYGITMVVDWARKKTALFGKIVVLSIIAGFVLSLGRYVYVYHFEYPVYAATWWGWENKAAIDYAKAQEDKYDMIFISNFYTGAELAYAFYTQYDPVTYAQARKDPVILADDHEFIKLGKYYFGSLGLNQKRLEANIIPPNSLYIGRPEEPAGDGVIEAPGDKRPLFHIHRTD